jgi:predicted membrane channel-forming protein YqfA (hemolysin III family)
MYYTSFWSLLLLIVRLLGIAGAIETLRELRQPDPTHLYVFVNFAWLLIGCLVVECFFVFRDYQAALKAEEDGQHRTPNT